MSQSKPRLPSPKQIKAAKDILKRAGYIDVYWCIEDIDQRDIENHEDDNGDVPSDYVPLTDKQLNEARRLIEYSHDCNYGITWDSIDCAIDEVR